MLDCLLTIGPRALNPDDEFYSIVPCITGTCPAPKVYGRLVGRPDGRQEGFFWYCQNCRIEKLLSTKSLTPFPIENRVARAPPPRPWAVEIRRVGDRAPVAARLRLLNELARIMERWVT